MQTVLITGGTGLVGKRLTQTLIDKNYHVIILSRSANKKNTTNISYALWNVEAQTIDAAAIEKADYIIHLAGAGVADKRWSKKRKQEIINSRTQSSSLIVKALLETPNKIKAVISASAIGWYGADTSTSKQNGFTENEPADTEFLGETCRLWEHSIEPVATINKRLVRLRIGIVLSKDGGALKEFIKPLNFGVATILGSGKQMISWIHIDDLCRMFIYAMENEAMHGVYNAVAPAQVTNKDLVLHLAKQENKFYIPVKVPAFILKIVMGEMSIEVLKSATVSADKIKNAGYNFLYPALSEALKHL